MNKAKIAKAEKEKEQRKKEAEEKKAKEAEEKKKKKEKKDKKKKKKEDKEKDSEEKVEEPEPELVVEEEQTEEEQKKYGGVPLSEDEDYLDVPAPAEDEGKKIIYVAVAGGRFFNGIVLLSAFLSSSPPGASMSS